ncbi:hypothetical protein BGY98DRAFT_982662 [Russula aff. rugulosa BPL654]|nr:hypothetical protein BGY98DRAFT_982662 [Russula aff. rugulosa BPL654]
MAGPIIIHTPPTPLAPTHPQHVHHQHHHHHHHHHHRRDERARPRVSHSSGQHIERRLIRLWKRMTGSVRRHERASILPDGFVLMNAAARRRSIHMASAKSS